MIFVTSKGVEKNPLDELKRSIFRYFKYLPYSYKNYSRIISSLADCLLVEMPQRFGTAGHLKRIIKPEIEFFYELCDYTRPEVLPKKRKVILLSLEEFQSILNVQEVPPCFIKVPFSMKQAIQKSLADDDYCCERCEWGKKLIRYRNILYHVNQIKEVWNGVDIDKINSYQQEDFIANLTTIEALLEKLLPVQKQDKDKLKDLTIYILEDDKTDKTKIEELLKSQGVEVVESKTATQDFLKNIIKAETDIKEQDAVILLDLVMLNEDIQGEDVCRNINQFSPFVPIFIISGKKEIFDIVNKMEGLKFDGFFCKNNLINSGTGDNLGDNIKSVYVRLLVQKMIKSVRDAKQKKKDRIYIESMRRTDNCLGIIVAGFGDFSQRTFGNLLKTIETMNNRNHGRIQLELLTIVEPYWQARLAATKRLKMENLDISVVKNIQEARNETYGYNGEIVIRDVSSSHQHVKNHQACQKKGDKNKDLFLFDKEIFHIVEKPIALDSQGIDVYNDDKFTSVLEEVENPAVLTVKDYIEENRLSINSLEFWRYSSIAWIQLLEGKRKGVRGGSYMDKSIHDWAVAYFLLNEPTSEKGSHKIIASEIEMFMPFSCDNLHKDFPVYNFMKSDENSTDNLQKAEDLKMTSEVVLKVDKGKTVNVKMHSSWGGVTESDEKGILRHDEFYLEGALYSKEKYGTVDFKARRHVDYKFFDQELRLGKVICKKDRSDEKITIYFNMLRRDDAGIYPFVKVIRNKSIFSIPLCQREGTSLDRIIEDSLLYFSGAEQTSKTGPEMSLFCHKIALKCLGRAIDNSKNREPIEVLREVQNHALNEKHGVKFFWD